MNLMSQLVVFGLATVVAAGVAATMVWVFLSGAFRLMRPSTVRTRAELAYGARAAARGLAAR